ncbi:MAG: tetratricopeptide repeat protein [Candidatus Omnitrophica bacterium]|nr:tetratricopeptide repeat protein [Candidatus Omnitrophota bacterium]
MPDSNALVLEILKQGSVLQMSVFEQGQISQTLRHYSSLAVSWQDIDNLCQEIANVLSKIDKGGKLAAGLIQRLEKAGQLLWDQLLTKSVKDRLRSTIIKDLILSLDEELIGIPWELVYDGKDFLSLKFNLGRLINTKEQLSPTQYRNQGSALKILILANPTGDLKSAYSEGLYIKNRFDRKRKEVVVDFKSTSIDSLYIKKNLRDYDIVHFAGHCEYDNQNPANTGWVLNDSRFSSQDILALGQAVPLPTLIFSNACYSAKGNPSLIDGSCQEKNYSLASAFLFSGVRHYIGTIWKIEDPLSLAFANEFYTRLIKGSSVGASLRLARLELIKEYGISSISWGSYILYGDPGFTFFQSKEKTKVIKFKRDKRLYRRWLVGSACLVAVLAVFLFLYLWLPTLNPNDYFIFIKAKKLSASGKNEGVVENCMKLIQKNPLFLQAYPLIARAYEKMGKKELALKYYFDYARYSEKKQDKNNLASAYISLAWAYQGQGDYAKAFDFYEKALVLSRQNQDRLNEAIALRKLAVWHIDNKNCDKAMELLMKSSEINRQREYLSAHRYNLACDYFDIGLVFANKEDFKAAREFYEKSYRLFEKMKLGDELSDAYFNLGEIYLLEKQYQKALDYYLRGLKIDQQQGNKLNIASDYNMIGELYLEMDNPKDAEDFFNKAVSLARDIKLEPELAAAYHNLGTLYKKLGRKNKAKEYMRQAQEIYYIIDKNRYQEIREELLGLSVSP